MRRASITDVARAARVSTATVSRVVNDNYPVAGGTRARVLGAIAKLAWQPNEIARSLKTSATKIIAFVVSDISNVHFTSMARAIEDRVSAEGYNIIVCSTDGRREREAAYLTTLVSRRVDGLIINTTSSNDAMISGISRTTPVVLVSRRLRRSPGFRGDFVDSDNRRGAGVLTRHLIGLGHRRIGVLNGPQTLSTGRERYRGFVDAMRESGLAVDGDYPLRQDGDFGEESGFAGARALCSRRARPTALIVMNNAMAIGALRYLRASGIRVPRDISVAAYGGIAGAELMYTQPSIVTLDPREIGTRAGELILQRLRDPDIGNRDVIVDSQLVPGTAVRRLAGRGGCQRVSAAAAPPPATRRSPGCG